MRRATYPDIYIYIYTRTSHQARASRNTYMYTGSLPRLTRQPKDEEDVPLPTYLILPPHTYHETYASQTTYRIDWIRLFLGASKKMIDLRRHCMDGWIQPGQETAARSSNAPDQPRLSTYLSSTGPDGDLTRLSGMYVPMGFHMG